jgi:hypothetical protein
MEFEFIGHPVKSPVHTLPQFEGGLWNIPVVDGQFAK